MLLFVPDLRLVGNKTGQMTVCNGEEKNGLDGGVPYRLCVSFRLLIPHDDVSAFSNTYI